MQGQFTPVFGSRYAARVNQLGGNIEATMASAFRSRTVVALSAVLLAVVFLVNVIGSYRTIIAHGTQYDDSFITYRYAANLAEGRGLAFNSYERVNSASSLLYTTLLAGMYRLGLTRMEQVAASVNIVAGVVGLVVAIRLCLIASGSPGVGFVLLLPVAISGAWAGWAASGMETVFYAALVLSLCWAYVTTSRRLTLILLIACLLSRPEGVLVWLAVLTTEWYSSSRGHRFLLEVAIVGGATLVALYGAYTLYFGTWIPQPAILKSVSRYYSPGLGTQARSAARFFLGGYAPLALVAAVGFAVRTRHLRTLRASAANDPRARLALLNGSFLGLTAASLLLGPHSDLMRYAIHTLPLLGVAAADAWPRARVFLPGRILACTCLLFTVASVWQAAFDARRTRSLFVEWSAHQTARKSLGKWIEVHTPKTSLVLSSDLGAIAYEARSHDFYDMGGLLSTVPLHAAKQNRWEWVQSDLRRRKPAFVCDTVRPDGELQAWQILHRPGLYFRGVKGPIEPLGVYEHVLTSIPAGRYRYELGALRWK